MGSAVVDRDVLLDKLALCWRQRWLRVSVSLSVSASLIVIYAVTVAFTSFLANLDPLASNLSWLSRLSHCQDAIKSVIEGVLPPALLQVLPILVPNVCGYTMQFQA